MAGVGRRGFLAGAGCAAFCAAAEPDGRQGHGKKKRRPPRVPVLPPGAGRRERFLTSCIGCGLCISKCPHHALVPAGLEYGLRGMQFPKLDFSKGFCDWDCHTCTKLCPAGALRFMSGGIKRRTKIGEAKWKRHHCVVVTDKVSCGLCARVCPAKAITMGSDPSGREVPVIDAKKCIGCGTCEYFCAARPKAIFVQGKPVHEFLFGGNTFVAALRNRKLWTSSKRGIQPLMNAFEAKVDMKGAVCHDRIVGRAAAFLFVKAGVAEVHSPKVSKGALTLLQRHGIKVFADELIDAIRNREGTGLCPMEKATAQIRDDDIDVAYQALIAAIEKLKN